MKNIYPVILRFFLANRLKKLYSLAIFILLFIANDAHAQWTRKADEISKRAEANNVIYKNKMYVFGGFGDNPHIEHTNEVYDIAADKWSAIASFPVGKETTHQGVVLVDDNVWNIGGRLVDAYGPVASQVIIYNITTNKWSDGPELIDPATKKPFPIGGGGYALIGRTIHVFGGFGPVICEDQATLHLTLDVDKYLADPKNTTWENKLAPMPMPRNHISYVVLGGKIYALGGQFKHDCLALDQPICHVYDPATDKWTRLTDIISPRSHAEASTFAVDGKIFLAAGQGVNNKTQSTVYQFTPEANNGLGAWSYLASYKLPGSFLGLSAKLVGSQFLITNGALDNYGNERTETYVANVTRTSTRKLGFMHSCLSKTVQSGTSATASNLIYNIEDTSPYTLRSNANWLTITKNSSGTATQNGINVEVTINTAGLAAGSYTGTITATGATAATTASFCVNLQVTGSTGTTSAIRINSGGPAVAVSGSRQFGADQYYGGIDRTSSLASGDIQNTTDDVIYLTERSSAAFNYNIPVQNGMKNVILHFAEIWYGVPGKGAGGAGKRLFNVDIEGSRKLTDYDIYASAGGALRAVQEAFDVEVKDGVLNIDFTTGAANMPKVSAIEVISVGTNVENNAPEIAPIGNKSVTVGQLLTFTATATDVNPGQTKVYSLVGAPSGAVINPSTGVFTWTPATSGTFTFNVKVTDNGTPAMSDQEQVTVVVASVPVNAAIRINSGGASVNTSEGLFAADQYYGGTDRTASISGGDILYTTDDALYLTERSSAAFDYSIPVQNGRMTVVLHFAEIYFGAPGKGAGGSGKRLFNVDIENSRKLTDYDIYAEAGGAMRAIQEVFEVTVTDGVLNIDFLSGLVNMPKVSAIEVIPDEAPVNTPELSPVADAAIRNGNYASVNYGSQQFLEIKASGTSGFSRTAYLRFSLEGVGEISSAKLRLYGSNTENATGIDVSVYGVTNDSWTENGINWSNAPAGLSAALSTVSVSEEAYYELDVTDYVAQQWSGDKTVSLLLRNSGNQNVLVNFNSKENDENSPRLIIETSESANRNARFGREIPEAAVKAQTLKSIIYPNPVQKRFAIVLSEEHTGDVSLSLVGTSGRIYRLNAPQPTQTGTESEVDLSELSLGKGIYILKIQSDAFTETAKLLIAE
jgi:N-acetylneuraminic acid mutarotase